MQKVDWASPRGERSVKLMYSIIVYEVSKSDVNANAKNNIEIKKIPTAKNDTKVAKIALLMSKPRNL